MLNSEMAVAYWRNIGQCISRNPRQYDVAIAYAQGIPTLYVADKISAFKKIGWVNACYRLSESASNYQRKFYEQYNFIVPVSEIVRNVFSETYPEFTNKMYVVRDIINDKSIKAMSEFVCDKKIDHSYPVLMTVVRLDKLTKGYDLAMETAQVLKNRKIKFKWYIIGEGPSRSDIERYIIESNLSDCFILLGATDNPYSYMRQCDVYVQTSRHEGFGLTIAEARILNRPVVCTNFDGSTVQITDGKNGLITSFAPEDIADSIERLLNDKVLYSEIQEYLKNEKKGNTEEIANFYKLIES